MSPSVEFRPAQNADTDYVSMQQVRKMVRKSKRVQVALVALTVGLLALNSTAALAQMGPMPGPGYPIIARPISPHTTPSQRAMQQQPQMYSDLRASKDGTTVAGPFVLNSKTQYEIAAGTLGLHVATLQMTGGTPLQLAAQQNNLAYVQEHLGQVDHALYNYTQALALMKAHGAGQLQMAIVEYNLGDMNLHEHHFLPALHYFRSAKARIEGLQMADKRPMQMIIQKYNEVRRLVLAEPKFN